MENEKFLAPKPKPKSENNIERPKEFIEAPDGCYFIHGVT